MLRFEKKPEKFRKKVVHRSVQVIEHSAILTGYADGSSEGGVILRFLSPAKGYIKELVYHIDEIDKGKTYFSVVIVHPLGIGTTVENTVPIHNQNGAVELKTEMEKGSRIEIRAVGKAEGIWFGAFFRLGKEKADGDSST